MSRGARGERLAWLKVAGGELTAKAALAGVDRGVAWAEKVNEVRRYAEVHLELEPMPRGAGMSFGARCSTDELDRNWQRLVLTHALEREHRGVLVGAPLADVHITLLGAARTPSIPRAATFGRPRTGRFARRS